MVGLCAASVPVRIAPHRPRHADRRGAGHRLRRPRPAPAAQWTAPSLCDGWSVKDTMAHLSWRVGTPSLRLGRDVVGASVAGRHINPMASFDDIARGIADSGGTDELRRRLRAIAVEKAAGHGRRNSASWSRSSSTGMTRCIPSASACRSAPRRRTSVAKIGAVTASRSTRACSATAPGRSGRRVAHGVRVGDRGGCRRDHPVPPRAQGDAAAPALGDLRAGADSRARLGPLRPLAQESSWRTPFDVVAHLHDQRLDAGERDHAADAVDELRPRRPGRRGRGPRRARRPRPASAARRRRSGCCRPRSRPGSARPST